MRTEPDWRLALSLSPESLVSARVRNMCSCDPTIAPATVKVINLIPAESSTAVYEHTTKMTKTAQ